jgi:hypothetical protein
MICVLRLLVKLVGAAALVGIILDVWAVLGTASIDVVFILVQPGMGWFIFSVCIGLWRFS